MFQKLLLYFFFFLLFSFLIGCNEVQENKEPIPEEAIRLRILANSDTSLDQKVKLAVRDAVNEEVITWAKTAKNIDDAREIIRNRLPEINAVITETLAEENVNYSHDALYSKKVDFPDKQYQDAFYPAGEYEAILITLGTGLGENWWCVLFPPLCFVDLTVETDQISETKVPQDEKDEKVKVKSILFKWLKTL